MMALKIICHILIESRAENLCIMEAYIHVHEYETSCVALRYIWEIKSEKTVWWLWNYVKIYNCRLVLCLTFLYKYVHALPQFRIWASAKLHFVKKLKVLLVTLYDFNNGCSITTCLQCVITVYAILNEETSQVLLAPLTNRVNITSASESVKILWSLTIDVEYILLYLQFSECKIHFFP
jgi:hypothetical protein